MVQSGSGTDRCNNNPNVPQQEQQCSPDDLFPFPGFMFDNEKYVEDYTPIATIPCGSVMNCANSAKSTEESSSTATTKTPPVEPSVSPEIQSGLSHSVLVSGATPSTCYGAGHVLSGVTDRRKCKARGILSVGRTNPFQRDTLEDNIRCVSYGKGGHEVFGKSRPSLIPLPAEASISWHLSPSHVDDDNVGKGDYSNGSYQSWKLVNSDTIHSPSSPCSTFSNPEFQGLLEPSLNKVVTKSSSTSPCSSPRCKAVLPPEKRTSTYDFNGECSPFSVASLSSGNVMQTPDSDSSLERHGSLTWLKEGIQLKHQFESEFDKVTDVLQHESLSPNSNISPWDPPGLSFESADLSSPSNPIDPNHLIGNSDCHASWISDSTLENVSQSQMRISWRDGLISSTSDKDDLDCCRLLSDEEMDTDGLFKSPKVLEHKSRVDGNKKETSSPSQLNSCAESTYTDDGGLIASGDSDWTLYYENRSFEI